MLTDGRNISHYALHLIGSEVILDLTKPQFPFDTEFSPWIVKYGDMTTGWDYVTMASAETRRRYEELSASVHTLLSIGLREELIKRNIIR